MLRGSCRIEFSGVVPRKPRIDFPGARHHVYDRGNYRKDIFASEGAMAAFESCMFEAATRFGWILHAYVIMINHFHLGLETPRGNLTESMHWLLSTYATRFNRFRDERGHLFQGRYNAKLVEGMLNLVNYIHLNPVEQGIVTVANLADYRWSSYHRFRHGPRPEFLICTKWLEAAGDLKDTPAGWRSYEDYLAVLAADTEEQKRRGFDKMCQGWAMGSQEWKNKIAAEHVDHLAALRLGGPEIGELKEAVWTRSLETLLTAMAKTRVDAANDRFGAPWKIELAEKLRLTTTATNAWIARELSMGSSSSVSVYLSQRRRKFKN